MTLYRLADGVAWELHPTPLNRPSDRPTSLNDLIGFDTTPVLVTVRPDGVVILDTDAPDASRGLGWLYAESDADGNHTADTDPDLIRQARAAGWEMVTGRSGQHGYTGPVFHPSECIGGGLVDLIAGDGDDTPRRTWWAVAVVEEYGTEADPDPDPSGWVLLYRDADS